MPIVTVDGVETEVPAGANALQACEAAGVEVPRFCYHDRLSVAGNCRMCLVDVEMGGRMAPKPTASCAAPVADGMKIFTKTERIQKARKGVMEFLLINHPLDCPICDQGGECDLQDQAMVYGFDASRYAENKRAVKEKYMGPLIKTIMTRCIQCTRCVRFATEIAGVEQIGLLNRGEHAEISTIEKAISSELSGNLVDVCPVGALTSKPYAFVSRPWELRKTQSVDVMDAVGSAIRVDARGREVLRVLPRLNEDVNEEWIADKTRHAIDGLRRQRLDRPYVRENGRLRAASWDEALSLVSEKLGGLKGEEIAAITGDQCDAESMFALKGLMANLGSENIDCRQDGAAIDSKARGNYLFNTGIAGIEEADAILLVGVNPRWDAPLVNARIRKRFLSGELKVSGIGEALDQTYSVNWLGNDASLISSDAAKNALKGAKKPMVIVGMGALARADGQAILAAARDLMDELGALGKEWNGFNVLHTAAARVGGLDMGFVSGKGGLATADILAGTATGAIKALYLLGADEARLPQEADAFVIYQGHHGDAGAAMADVILPGAAYTEKNGTYVNTEGRVQSGRIAAFPPGDAREDWTIIRALSGALGNALPFDSLNELRQALVSQYPTFGKLDEKPVAKVGKINAGKVKVEATEIASTIQNYYMTCPVSRASETMAECTEALLAAASAPAAEAA